MEYSGISREYHQQESHQQPLEFYSASAPGQSDLLVGMSSSEILERREINLREEFAQLQGKEMSSKQGIWVAEQILQTDNKHEAWTGENQTYSNEQETWPDEQQVHNKQWQDDRQAHSDRQGGWLGEHQVHDEQEAWHTGQQVYDEQGVWPDKQQVHDEGALWTGEGQVQSDNQMIWQGQQQAQYDSMQQQQQQQQAQFGSVQQQQQQQKSLDGRGSELVKAELRERLLEALRQSESGRVILEEGMRKEEMGRMNFSMDQFEAFHNNRCDQGNTRSWEERQRMDGRLLLEERREERQRREEHLKAENLRKQEERREMERHKEEERRRAEAERHKVEEERHRKAEERRKAEEKRFKAEEARRRAEEEKRKEEKRKEKEKRQEEERRCKEEEERRIEKERKRRENEEKIASLRKAEEQEGEKIAELLVQLEELKSSRLTRTAKRKEDEEKLKQMRLEHRNNLAKEEEAAAKKRTELEAEIAKQDAQFATKQGEVSLQLKELLKDSNAESISKNLSQGDSTQCHSTPVSHLSSSQKNESPLPFSQFLADNLKDSSQLQKGTTNNHIMEVENNVKSSRSADEKIPQQLPRPNMISPSTSTTSEDKEPKSTKRVIRVKKRVVKKQNDEESPKASLEDKSQVSSSVERSSETQVDENMSASGPVGGAMSVPHPNLSNKIEEIAASLSEFAKAVKEKKQLKSQHFMPTQEMEEADIVATEADFFIDSSGAGDPFVEEEREVSKLMKERALTQGTNQKQVTIPGLDLSTGLSIFNKSKKRTVPKTFPSSSDGTKIVRNEAENDNVPKPAQTPGITGWNNSPSHAHGSFESQPSQWQTNQYQCGGGRGSWYNSRGSGARCSGNPGSDCGNYLESSW